MTSSFCVHCHFHQPARGDRLAADAFPDVEPGAQPHTNFVEKAADVCYKPNADLGNFDMMSFDFGPSLLDWMRRAVPEVYAAVASAGRAQAHAGAGKALALPQHHTILPLARRRDKITQVTWGLASFAHHFGYPAEGLWLPEMAVDLETLETLAALGVKFTILSGAQVSGADQGGGPYWVNLGEDRRIAAYVRDDTLSNQIAFELPSLGGAARWARGTLGPRRKSGSRLTLVATDGESFGYHHRGEEHFLHWLLSYEAHAVGFEVTALGRDLRDNPPQAAIEIKEFSSWNCPHGRLQRWSSGCECTPGDSGWKGALRRALDNLASAVDELYVVEAASRGVNPWPLRDAYIRVALGQVTGPELLRQHGLEALRGPQSVRLLTLLEATAFRQCMYASHAFFYEDLARPEARFVIASAAHAAELAQQAVGQDCLASLRSDLSLASSADGRTGAQLLDEILGERRA